MTSTRFLAFLLVVPLLSGCATGPANQSITEADPEVVIQDPLDFQNASLPGSHVHDYWRGAARIPVFDAQASLTYTTVTVCPGGFNPVETNCLELEPLERGLVAPGAASLELQVSWDSVGAGPDPFIDVYFEAPRRDGGFESGEFRVLNGESFTLNVTESVTDLPHTSQTRWRFWVTAGGGIPGTTYNVQINIDAVRGEGAIPAEPPHPDHWRNKSRLLLLAHQGPFNEALGQNDLPGLGEHPGFDFTPTTGIIPPSTDLLVVKAYLNVTSPVETAPQPVLNFRGADRRDPEESRLPPTASTSSANALQWEWRVNVEPRMWDSPYAVATSWKIFIDWHGGTGPASATYTQGDVAVFVEAHRG